VISDTDGAGLFETLNVGWTADSQDISKSCYHKLAQCLWYLDSYHQKSVDRGMKLPKRFSSKDTIIIKERRKGSLDYQLEN